MPNPFGTPGRVLPPGTQLGKYTLERLLARGGMAELYLARQEGARGFEKLVALKLVLPHLVTNPKFLEMFLDEARLAGRLDHPNIAQVLDLGAADGEHFMAMEYVHGVNVRDLLANAEESATLPLDAAVTIVVEASRGLHYAHELVDEDGTALGIVHRDVSPSNLLLRYDGGVKLVDFGIAKAANRNQQTATGILKGKSGYMSPEQCRGLPLDRRSDIFGLGILLYELTTCQRLFYGDNEFSILNRVVDGEFERPSEVAPDYPVELENIVLQALDPRVENRFATAQELQDALETFARNADLQLSTRRVATMMRGLFGDPPPPTASRPLGARTGPLTSTLRGQRTRRAALGLGLGGLALATAGYLVGTASSSPQDPSPPPTAAPAVSAPAVSAPAGSPDPAEPKQPTPAKVEVPEPPKPEVREVPPDVEPASTEQRKRKNKKRGKNKTKRRPKAGRDANSMMPRE